MAISRSESRRGSRYLQVLTQARKMGKDTISSRARPTTPTSTPPRSSAISPASASSGSAASATTSTRSSARSSDPPHREQHNIALFGAGNLGQAIASSDIFTDHGFRIVAMFDVDREVIGGRVGGLIVRSFDDIDAIDEGRGRGRGARGPAGAAQEVADRLVRAGVKIIFNYSEQLLQVPPDVTVHTSSPAVDLLYALYFYLT